MKLIKGKFKKEDALELLTGLVHAKIKFYESKIEKSHNVENKKMREKRIKELQEEFYEAKKLIVAKSGWVDLESEILIS